MIAAHPEAELVAWCDRDPQRLGVTSQAFEEERPDLFGNFDDVLGRQLGAVALANDAHAHAQLAIAALQAGAARAE